MKFIKAYLYGWKNLFQSLRLWGLLYLINFAFAIIASLGLNSFLSSTIGDSIASIESLERFSYTIIGDLLNEHGESLGFILNNSIGIVIIYLIITIFTSGGIVYLYYSESRMMGDFWKASGEYFWRFLRLTFYFLIFNGTLFFVFFMLYRYFALDYFPFKLEKESTLSNTFKIVVPIYLIFASFFWMVQDFSKYKIVESKTRLLIKPVLNSFAFVMKNYIPCLLFYLLNLITFLVFYYLYYFFSNKISSSSELGILLFFLFAQLFILLRIALKLINLAGIAYLNRELKQN